MKKLIALSVVIMLTLFAVNVMAQQTEDTAQVDIIMTVPTTISVDIIPDGSSFTFDLIPGNGNLQCNFDLVVGDNRDPAGGGDPVIVRATSYSPSASPEWDSLVTAPQHTGSVRMQQTGSVTGFKNSGTWIVLVDGVTNPGSTMNTAPTLTNGAEVTDPATITVGVNETVNYLYEVNGPDMLEKAGGAAGVYTGGLAFYVGINTP